MKDLHEVEKGNDANVEIVVNSTQGTMTKSFVKTAKIQDIITAVIDYFGFAKNGSYEIRKDSDPQLALMPERPLVSYQIENREVLIFTDLGIAV